MPQQLAGVLERRGSGRGRSAYRGFTHSALETGTSAKYETSEADSLADGLPARLRESPSDPACEGAWHSSFLGSFRPLVFVIEGDSAMDSAVAKTLSREYRTQVSEDAMRGTRKARHLRPDLIICGPRKSGIGADARIEALRGYIELRSTPILILAAEANEALHAEMLHGRVQDYITKPFHPAEISARVRNLLAARRQEAELRMLSTRLISAQENERKRIARELHDDFSQRLAALCMEVSLIEERPAAGMERIRTVREGLGRIAHDINLLSRRFHSSVLQSVGLEAAIRSECTDFAEREGISVEFVAETVPDSLSEEISLCIYRVAQESLRNISKHARTQTARVMLIANEETVSLSVKDSGVGFDPEQCAYGLGLISMRERVRSLSGTLTIRSAPGRGSDLTLSVPYREVADE